MFHGSAQHTWTPRRLGGQGCSYKGHIGQMFLNTLTVLITPVISSASWLERTYELQGDVLFSFDLFDWCWGLGHSLLRDRLQYNQCLTWKIRNMWPNVINVVHRALLSCGTAVLYSYSEQTSSSGRLLAVEQGHSSWPNQDSGMHLTFAGACTCCQQSSCQDVTVAFESSLLVASLAGAEVADLPQHYQWDAACTASFITSLNWLWFEQEGAIAEEEGRS